MGKRRGCARARNRCLLRNSWIWVWGNVERGFVGAIPGRSSQAQAFWGAKSRQTQTCAAPLQDCLCDLRLLDLRIPLRETCTVFSQSTMVQTHLKCRAAKKLPSTVRPSNPKPEAPQKNKKNEKENKEYSTLKKHLQERTFAGRSCS